MRFDTRRRDLIWNRSLCHRVRARIEIRTDVEKRLKVAAITGFTAGEMEGNWQATEAGLQVTLGRETATRAAKRLIMLPPLWMARPSRAAARDEPCGLIRIKEAVHGYRRSRDRSG